MLRPLSDDAWPNACHPVYDTHVGRYGRARPVGHLHAMLPIRNLRLLVQ